MFLFLSQASIIHKVITSYFKDTFDWFSDVTCLCFLSRRYISFLSPQLVCVTTHTVTNHFWVIKHTVRNHFCVIMYWCIVVAILPTSMCRFFDFLLKWIGKKCVCQLKHFSYNELDLCQLLSISLFQNWVWQHLN